MTVSFRLDGTIALVTGSSQGIGFFLAKGLAQAGARVVINGRDAAKLEAARTQLAALDVYVDCAAFDVTDAAAAKAGIAGSKRDWRDQHPRQQCRYQRRTPLEDFPLETWDEITSTNLDSVFFVAQAVARHMIPRGKGSIINVCSVQSELGVRRSRPIWRPKGP